MKTQLIETATLARSLALPFDATRRRLAAAGVRPDATLIRRVGAEETTSPLFRADRIAELRNVLHVPAEPMM